MKRLSILALLFTSLTCTAANRIYLEPDVYLEINDGTVYAVHKFGLRKWESRQIRISKFEAAKKVILSGRELFLLDKDGRLWAFDRSKAAFRVNKALIVTRNCALFLACVVDPVMLSLIHTGIVQPLNQLSDLRDVIIWLTIPSLFFYKLFTWSTADWASVGSGANYFTKLVGVDVRPEQLIASVPSDAPRVCGRLLKARLFNSSPPIQPGSGQIP